MRHRRPDLPTLLDQLAEAVELGEGRLNPAVLAPARAVLDRARDRTRLASGRTVVALLGATGSGKSSLFNALVGDDVATVGARRPTTSQPLAAVVGEDEATGLLDWLGVPRRVPVPARDGLDGLVLLDLPDIDSTDAANREVAARLAGTVDVLVWVLDPQKYADAVVHRDFLAPMAEHADVTLVVLNQLDRLAEPDRAAVLADVRGLLERDGVGGVEVVGTSAASGAGVAALRDRLAAVVARRTAAQQRLAADVRTAAAALAQALGPAHAPAGVDDADRVRLERAAAEAAGAQVVATAVRRGAVRAARAHVGWPPLRWLQRLRPDPVRRLHLATGIDPELVRTSLPAPAPVQEAAVRAAAHAVVASSTSALPATWRTDVLTRTEAQVPQLVEALDGAVATTDLEQGRSPAWWRVVGLLQWLLLTGAVVGLAWLGALVALDYLRIPPPEQPVLGPVPWPTVLAVGGVVLGLVLAGLAGAAARVGARRRAARVERRIRAAVATTVERELLTPVRAELAAHEAIAAAVRALRG